MRKTPAFAVIDVFEVDIRSGLFVLRQRVKFDRDPTIDFATCRIRRTVWSKLS